jgi:hypothetical protein
MLDMSKQHVVQSTAEPLTAMASDKTYFENGTWAPPFEEVDTKVLC